MIIALPASRLAHPILSILFLAFAAGCDRGASVSLVLERPAPTPDCADDHPPDLAELFRGATTDESLAAIVARLAAPGAVTPEALRGALRSQSERGPNGDAPAVLRLAYRDANARTAADVAQAIANAMVESHIELEVAYAKELAAAFTLPGAPPDADAVAQALRTRLTVYRTRRRAGWQVRVLESAYLDPRDRSGFLATNGDDTRRIEPGGKFESRARIVYWPPLIAADGGPPCETAHDRLDRLARSVTSSSRLSKMIDDLKLYTERAETEVREEVVAHLRSQLRSTTLAGKDRIGLQITFRDPSPETAQKGVDYLADRLVEAHKKERAEGAGTAWELLRDLREQIARELDPDLRFPPVPAVRALFVAEDELLAALQSEWATRARRVREGRGEVLRRR